MGQGHRGPQVCISWPHRLTEGPYLGLTHEHRHSEERLTYHPCTHPKPHTCTGAQSNTPPTRMRSNADGVPPLCTWPSTVTRVSKPSLFTTSCSLGESKGVLTLAAHPHCPKTPRAPNPGLHPFPARPEGSESVSARWSLESRPQVQAQSV